MIIAVEGLDGAGKTTVSRMLAESIGAAYVALPPPTHSLVTSTLFRQLDSEARYLYYLSGVVSLAETAQKSRVLVADRFVASAHAMHLHVTTELARQLRKLPLPTADMTLYLDVDEVTRRQRLYSRGAEMDPFELRLDSDDSFRHLVAQQMQAYPRTHIINTSGRHAEHVAAHARRIYNEVCRALKP